MESKKLVPIFGDSDLKGSFNKIKRIFTESFSIDGGRIVLSEESIKKVPEKKSYEEVATINVAEMLTDEDKALTKKLLLDKQMARFYRKKIESFVSELLRDKPLIMASDIPITNRKDFENLIYIRLFAIESLVYRVKNTDQRVKTDKCEFTDFEIIRKQTGDKNV